MSARVASYYAGKTARILAKYGPGPRIHFHTGLGAGPPPAGADATTLRDGMVRAQERLVERVLGALPRVADVLDVGCGLGGTALLLAGTRGVRVTAATIVPEHVDVVAGLAREAGCARLVKAVLCDAHHVGFLGHFDAALALESSCYFDRAAWLAQLHRTLPPGGEVHVVDCFLGSGAARERFDAYWQTRIGTPGEYEEAADAAGFATSVREDWSTDAADFWRWSRAWSVCAGEGAVPEERARLERSIEEHRWLEDAMRGGAIRYLRWTFVRR